MSTLHYDPYTWRLDELRTLHQPTGSQRDAMHTRGQELDAELVVAEAEELAHGRRHLTIEHGPVDDVLDCDRLDALTDAIDTLTAVVPVRRIARTAEHLTVTVAGPDAPLVVAAIAEQAAFLNPGHWHLTPSARPAHLDDAG